MDECRAKIDWFKAVVLPYEPALRSRLKHLGRQSEEIDDLIGEVFLRAYANANWRGITHGRAYLLTIVRNLVIDMARREKIVSFEAVTAIEQFRSEENLDAQLCARDELRRVQSVIARLPAQYRRVFIARRIEQKSMGEIAEDCGLSVSTVEKHLAKAIRLFMKTLASEQDSASDAKEPTESETRGGRGRGRTSSRLAQP